MSHVSSHTIIYTVSSYINHFVTTLVVYVSVMVTVIPCADTKHATNLQPAPPDVQQFKLIPRNACSTILQKLCTICACFFPNPPTDRSYFSSAVQKPDKRPIYPSEVAVSVRGHFVTCHLCCHQT